MITHKQITAALIALGLESEVLNITRKMAVTLLHRHNIDPRDMFVIESLESYGRQMVDIADPSIIPTLEDHGLEDYFDFAKCGESHLRTSIRIPIGDDDYDDKRELVLLR